jgi:periplasmic divalent cation tolerance protein
MPAAATKIPQFAPECASFFTTCSGPPCQAQQPVAAPMPTLAIVTTTTSSREEAKKLAAALLAARCIACAQISGPITSLYRWQNKETEAEEWLLTVKTTTAMTETVREAISRNHSYSVPEILIQEVSGVHPPYFAWLVGEVSG